MKINGREIYNKQVQERTWNKHISNCLHDIVQSKIAQRKEETKNSNENKVRQNARNVAQSFNSCLNIVVENLRSASAELADEILMFVNNEFFKCSSLKKAEYINNEIDDAKIESLVNSCLPALKKLKALSSHELILKNNYNAFSDYEKLFNDLIGLDLRFAAFAPSSCSSRTIVKKKMQVLPEVLRCNIENEINFQNEGNQDFVSRNNGKNNNEQIKLMVDKVNDIEFKSKIDVIESVERLSLETYRFIVKELKLQEFDEVKLKYSDIKNSIDLCSHSLAALKKYSNDCDLNKVSGWEKHNPYNELFFKLINLNIKFAFFAPKQVLSSFGMDYKRLNEKEKDVMFDLLNQYGLWEDKEFYENYYSLFLAQFGKNYAKNEI